ncbi:MAG: carbon starvation protein A [bacterium]
MNSLVLLLIALCVFALAYRYYAAFLAARVLMLNDSRVTPAVHLNNGQDYIPTNKWVVFGHHFAAIAGAGPLIGPTLAAQFGWGPGFLWILVGSVFAGCVHDMVILFGSVRHGGQSIAVIARRDVGRVTGFLTAIAILFVIVASLAGLGVAVVNAMKNNAWGTFSIAMTIPIAMGIGLYMFRLRPGAILSGSIVGVTLVCAAVFCGPWVAASGFAGWFTFSPKTISWMLPVYGFCAAILPVWLLLAPRDYLSTFMKIGVIAALAIGVIAVHPDIQMPFASAFIQGGGPIISGPWWPYVFITIACGAISGFHALISSGTTPKMIEKESHIPFIGYGAMVTEAFVSLMALIAATTLMPADFFAINSSKEKFDALGLAVVNLPELSQLVGLDVAHRPGGAISLAVGMAHIFASIGEGLKHTMKYWFQFIIMFEALFILTTIDAGTRVGRYILQDLLGYAYAPFRKVDWLPGVLLCGGLISCAWGYLLYTGDISSIWPMFGAVNQTLSALALAIGTTIILRVAKRKVYALTTAIPCLFLTVVTFCADVLNIRTYYAKHDLLKLWLSAGVLVIVAVVIADNVRVWLRLLKTREPAGLNDGCETHDASMDVPE